MTLEAFFKANPSVAVAFSGGADSAFLLYEAKKYAARVGAYYVRSPFQPEFELWDAQKLAQELNVAIKIINLPILDDIEIAKNPENRCYFCKKKIFSAICERAKADGFSTICDGTNASDDASDRPGMQALKELQIVSPLRLCGFTKADVREQSKQVGLFTWNKPAYACLATRVPTGEQITAEILSKTERAEEFLRALGLRDFRVRYLGGAAKVQVSETDLPLVYTGRKQILEQLGALYTEVLLDLRARDE